MFIINKPLETLKKSINIGTYFKLIGRLPVSHVDIEDTLRLQISYFSFKASTNSVCFRPIFSLRITIRIGITRSFIGFRIALLLLINMYIITLQLQNNNQNLHFYRYVKNINELNQISLNF